MQYHVFHRDQIKSREDSDSSYVGHQPVSIYLQSKCNVSLFSDRSDNGTT